uniref:uncharacterized protein LOC100187055 isoform X2 n=1 Tax=Ciona intestinalis TaxID=7719 RepID=UPI0002B8EEFA|nr:uncharacterized protein LOC100187055 isoform X2 [Ciona intestinalis]|eukprot:XP_002129288.2 uncharacterized protein LOC100187055 isoform X2 [Ciona intestinalis]
MSRVRFEFILLILSVYFMITGRKMCDQSGQIYFEPDQHNSTPGYSTNAGFRGGYSSGMLNHPSIQQFSDIVQIPAEPDHNRVVESALEICKDKKQPVQNPPGNGSPEHLQIDKENRMNNSPLSLRLAPNGSMFKTPHPQDYPYPNMVSSHNGCKFHSGHNFDDSYVIHWYESMSLREPTYPNNSTNPPPIKTNEETIPKDFGLPPNRQYQQHEQHSQNSHNNVSPLYVQSYPSHERLQKSQAEPHLRHISDGSNHSDETRYSYFETPHVSYDQEKTEHQPQHRRNGAAWNNVPPAHPNPTPDSEKQTGQTRPYQQQTVDAAAAPPVNAPAMRENIKVFITYAEAHNEEHMRQVVQISQTLIQNRIDVKVDMLEENMQSLSISDWLNSALYECDFVLICVSPGYMQEVDPQEGESLKPGERALNTKYIYRRLLSEYIAQSSRNYRFIPVLVSNGDRCHVPHWLRDTKIYKWPTDFEDIFYRLLKQEKYIKPKMGPVPNCIIERYDSVSARSNSRNSGRKSRTPVVQDSSQK